MRKELIVSLVCSTLLLLSVVITFVVAHFDYPIFLDDKGLFSDVNPHIPSDVRFHTFLLDSNGSIALLGDPVNNPKLWELYKTTITQLIENDGAMPTTEK